MMFLHYDREFYEEHPCVFHSSTETDYDRSHLPADEHVGHYAPTPQLMLNSWNKFENADATAFTALTPESSMLAGLTLVEGYSGLVAAFSGDGIVILYTVAPPEDALLRIQSEADILIKDPQDALRWWLQQDSIGSTYHKLGFTDTAKAIASSEPSSGSNPSPNIEGSVFGAWPKSKVRMIAAQILDRIAP